MALFDLADFTSRLIATIPRVWFGDASLAPDTPTTPSGAAYALLSGVAAGDTALYANIQTLKQNTRILSTQDLGVLALMAQDFLGVGVLPPYATETANAYRSRLLARLLLPGGTREGIRRAVFNLTGTNPTIIEPWSPGDCGAWDAPTWGFDVAGAWGDQTLPWQGFLRIQRPVSVASNGTPYYGVWDGFAGYDSPSLYYADLTPIQTISDAAIYQAVAAAKPEGVIAWVQLR